MKVVELFFGTDWLEYKVLYVNRTTKYVSVEVKRYPFWLDFGMMGQLVEYEEIVIEREVIGGIKL